MANIFDAIVGILGDGNGGGSDGGESPSGTPCTICNKLADKYCGRCNVNYCGCRVADGEHDHF